ncbi:type II secretion system protein GspM [Niveibacterium sp. SC-1]|uniref:type II secretion system protein GspM n=1 Tax=Niveibacterium sp. SC-1 TaxID=3135646 RepID=UPI00311E5818
MKALARFSNWWNTRAPRERQMLAAMALVVGGFVLWSLWSWSLAERARLARSLPAAKARLAAMRDDAAELQRLKHLPAKAAITPSALAEALGASATAHQLTLNFKADDASVHVTGSAPLDEVLNWLGEVLRDHGVTASRLVLARDGNHAKVEADLIPSVQAGR